MPAPRSLQASIADRSRIHPIVRSRNTPALFDWMVETFNFQGISDRVAASYLDRLMAA